MDKISWWAPEYIHREKSADWYWIVAIVTFSIALISIILNNIIFAILIIVSAFALSLFASRKPQELLIEVDNLGITAGGAHHPYGLLESFWVETRDRHPRIILKSKKSLSPFLTILIEDASPEEIRRKLGEHLPEEEHVEPILEKLLIYLGF